MYLRLVGLGHSVIVLRERLYRYNIQSDSLGGGRTSLLRNHRWISECIRKWDPNSPECIAPVLTAEEYGIALKRFILGEAFAVGGFGGTEQAAALFGEAAELPYGDLAMKLQARLGKLMPGALPRGRKALANMLHRLQNQMRRSQRTHTWAGTPGGHAE